MTKKLFLDLLWMQVWNRIAEAEGWNSETDIYEYRFVDIEPLEHDGDHIDAVMFFPEGTIEFHLRKEQDAFCWDSFPIEVIEGVYARINL